MKDIQNQQAVIQDGTIQYNKEPVVIYRSWHNQI